MTFDEAVASSEEVLIWTDGACHPNPDGYGGWACVFHAGGARFELSGSEHPATNNRMELTAALRALEAIGQQRRRVTLTSDSSYLVNAFNKGWLEGWDRQGRLSWVKSDRPLPNVILWRALRAAAAWHDITWVHVRGHGRGGTVCEENEACDRLAVAARKALRAEREGVES